MHAMKNVEAEGVCVFCGQKVVDGSEESGYTGEGPDWMTAGGDFGCDKSPISCKHGVGSHAVTEAEAIEAQDEALGEPCSDCVIDAYRRREGGDDYEEHGGECPACGGGLRPVNSPTFRRGA